MADAPSQLTMSMGPLTQRGQNRYGPLADVNRGRHLSTRTEPILHFAGHSQHFPPTEIMPRKSLSVRSRPLHIVSSPEFAQVGTQVYLLDKMRIKRESRVTGDVFMQVQCDRFGVAALEAPRVTVKQSVPLLRQPHSRLHRLWVHRMLSLAGAQKPTVEGRASALTALH